MLVTSQVTFDNLSLHAVVIPSNVFCRRVTLREHATDASPVGYSVAAPSSGSTIFLKYAGEPIVFEAIPGVLYQAGDTVGYVQPTTGTVTFDVIYE